MRNSVLKHIFLSTIFLFAWMTDVQESEAEESAIHTVNTLDDTVDGTCDATHCSLREAIEYAASGDTINFQQSLNGGTITLGGEHLVIDKSLTIDASALPDDIVVSGNHQSRIFYVGSSAVFTLENITIQNGVANAGGGIFIDSITNCYLFFTVCESTKVVIANTIFKKNKADSSAQQDVSFLNQYYHDMNSTGGEGGAVFSGGGDLSIYNSQFFQNEAKNGGAISALNFFESDSHAAGNTIVKDSLFENNVAADSGGAINIHNPSNFGTTGCGGGGIIPSPIFFEEPQITAPVWCGRIYSNFNAFQLENSIIRNNSAQAGGGYFDLAHIETGVSASFTNSIIEANQADIGGGIFSSSAFISNSSIIKNKAETGGGIYAVDEIYLLNSTLSYNEAVSGGGLFLSSLLYGNLISNTITHNKATVGGGLYLSTPKNGYHVPYEGGPYYPSKFIFVNNIVVGQEIGLDCYTNSFMFPSNGYNLDSDGSCQLDQPTDIPNGNAQLDTLADNGSSTETHALLAGSDAIDAGDDAVCFGEFVQGVDQRGMPRGVGEACDIGAYEVAQYSLTHTDGESNDTVVAVPLDGMAADIYLEFAPEADEIPLLEIDPDNKYNSIDVPFELDAKKAGVVQEDFVFAEPVTMTLSYESEAVAEDAESGVLLMVEENGNWVDAATTCSPASVYVYDEVNNRVSVEICHLSRYSWFAPLGPTAVGLGTANASQAAMPWSVFWVLMVVLGTLFLLAMWYAKRALIR